MEDLNSRTASVIGERAEEETPANPDRDSADDSLKEEVVVGDPVVNDEPEELAEETGVPEYEPLEPDEPA